MLHLKPIAFQFRKKPETCIGVVGRRVSVLAECLVFSYVAACYWGVNIHESIRRLAIADTNRESNTREIGCSSLAAGR